MTNFMIDSSRPPASLGLPSPLPAGTAAAIAGYIGGDTPYVWTAQDWARFTVPKLPIWVYCPSFPDIDGGVMEGFRALVGLQRLGVPAGHPVCIDMEARWDPNYVDAFTEVMNLAQYWCVVYGSASTVFNNPVRGGYWVADWPQDGAPPVPHMYPRAGVIATQFGSWTSVDVSVITSTLLGQLWR
jgi:hypothetical protein